MTNDNPVQFRGDFHRIQDFTLKPKPLNTAERPDAELFQGGNSVAARGNGGYHFDWYLSNGKDFDGITEQVVEVRDHARETGREVKVGVNGFIIARDTEREAKETLREIIAKAHKPAVDGLRAAVQQAGNSTADKRGMRADSTLENLVQYNDGFRTQLIGSPERIAELIAVYRKRGVDLILGGLLHVQEEIEYVGSRVLSLVREIEAAERDSVASRCRSLLGSCGPAVNCRCDTPMVAAPAVRCASVKGRTGPVGPLACHNRRSAAGERGVTKLEERP